MKIQRAYKTELDPNDTQRAQFLCFCGAARFVYNWGLSRKREQRVAGERVLSCQKLDGELRGIMDAQFPWLRDVSKEVRQSSLANLDRNFNYFFGRVKKGAKGRATGYPKFKSRKKAIGSFRVYYVTVEKGHIRLPKIGRVRLKESDYIPQGNYKNPANTWRIIGTTVSERAGRWFVSVQVEEEVPEPQVLAGEAQVLGVDFGIKTLATCSDGATFENPKSLKKALRKIKRVSRAMSRKQKGSQNHKKAKLTLATIHARVADVRRHTLHHVSHTLTRKASVLCIEDLNVAGMLKNHRLAQAIGDASFGELRRQIGYKATWRGVQVLTADRFFPSSKTCSSCGTIRESLELSERVFRCCCGFRLDRDLNAARNLAALALKSNVAASHAETLNACGEERSGALATARETGLCEAGSGLEALASTSLASVENDRASFVRLTDLAAAGLQAEGVAKVPGGLLLPRRNHD